MHQRLRPFEPADVDYIVQNIREDDRRELEANGFSVPDGLQVSVDGSTHMITGIDKDGNPAFIMGARKEKYGNTAVIWLLGTDAIEKEPKTFLLNSKPTLETLYELVGVTTFYNFVWKHNHLHVRWLKWLGFTLQPQDEEGPHKDFIFFYKHRE